MLSVPGGVIEAAGRYRGDDLVALTRRIADRRFPAAHTAGCRTIARPWARARVPSDSPETL
ncbi:Uncharacterised protein [Nocardia africana]|uniref:Uncharacterized protein n=1 Tax=Nocardia africana TaxID=134964 RepID=A0A378WS11_9NOCA|nr:Uncharacterised protein [Nocardia africana]